MVSTATVEAPAETYTKETITPEIAQEWLDTCNNRNRPVVAGRVEHYARQMSVGQWRFTGETIQFDRDGNLLNGQHRLMAIVLSGVSVEILVVRGLDSEVFPMLDTGAVRSGGAMLALMGETNCNALAAALNVVWRYERGNWHRSGPPIATPEDLRRTLEKHPRIREFNSDAYRIRSLMPYGSVAWSLAYLFSQRDERKAAEFFARLADGADLSIQNPVRLLRERLIRNRDAKAKLPAREVTALSVKAWNAFQRGDLLAQLKWTASGDRTEPFPAIEGGRDDDED